MKNALIVVGVSILILACTGPATAQEIELSPELKNWEPVLGKWSYEVEFRESPTSEWKKGSLIWEFRSGGFFVEIRKTGELGGPKHSGIEIFGYDPFKRTYVSSFFNSNGIRGGVTSMDWSGTTLNVNATIATAERETFPIRVSWEHSSDFKSVMATFETFTDGTWWISRKMQGSKVE